MPAQVEQPTGLPGAFHAVVGRPLAGPLEHPAQWVHYEDGDATKFIQRNGSLFQNNKGARPGNSSLGIHRVDHCDRGCHGKDASRRSEVCAGVAKWAAVSLSMSGACGR